jgi:hypothetical protein
MSASQASIACPSCAEQVPGGTYCVRCGARLDGPAVRARRRSEFAAAPHEHRNIPALISSLFPHLPRGEATTFRLSLAGGIAVVVALVLAGLYPLATIAGAVLVPILTLLYLHTIDVYEGEPPLVLAATALSGAIAGTAIGLLTQKVTATGADALTASQGASVLVNGVLLPLALFALALAGPLVLLRHNKFNDVLDGVAFGATTGAAAVAAQVLTFSGRLFDAGLRPPGTRAPWVARIVDVALASPVLMMSAVAIAAGALWLRKAPRADRDALGPLGSALTAIPLAAALVVLGAIGEPLLAAGWWLLTLLALDAVALWCVRQLIHVGLLEEAAEIPIGPPFQCVNCGGMTARHSFCGACGISLRALPKAPQPAAVPRPLADS